MKENKYIRVVGAGEHNLNGFDVSIPVGSFTVVTGVSGSGKSSLAFDTIFREGQRLYLETFSGYAKAYTGKIHKPKADSLEGLMPAIALDQKTTTGSIRSTVGTMSEIYDHLRLLYARIGTTNEDYTGPEPDRSLFSFNSPKGACQACKGLGVQDKIDPELLIADGGKTIREGAFAMTTPSGYIVYSQVTMDVLNQVCNEHGFSVDTAWNDLTSEQQNIVLHGSTRIKVPFGKHTLESRLKWSGITAKPREEGYYTGIITIMEDILKRDRNDNILRYARSVTCTSCNGSRLNDNARSVYFAGKNIAEVNEMTLSEAYSFLHNACLDGVKKEAAAPIIEEIINRINVLSELGLEYLTLDRVSTTLSGGEAQRIRLAIQTLGDLRNVLYVLDEPSIGLHPKHNLALLNALKKLKDKGNTLLVVEHDEDFIRNSQWLIDIGSQAGTEGGNLLYSGRTKDFFAGEFPESITWNLLKKKPDFSGLSKQRQGTGKKLVIQGASHHNLKDITAEFKLGCLNVVCGVSGAGKSTLTEQILAKYLRKKLHKSKDIPGDFQLIIGYEFLDKIIDIDQSAIGRTPRSNPATYTKLFDHIRAEFAQVPMAKERGYKKNRFSFNIKGGRCEACQGAGVQEIGMHFAKDVSYKCPRCEGKRFNKETLEIKLSGKNIFDVLELTVDEAAVFFEGNKKIKRILKSIKDVGLGYITLGQPSTTLSGGEAQRVKLATELAKPNTGSTIYILDEPTTGLHLYDIKILMSALHKLADSGNTIIIIEHHTHIVFSADYVLELGPGSGPEGGNLVFCGTPAELYKSTESEYINYLAEDKQQIDFSKNSLPEVIELKDVNTNNLKNVSLTVPHNSLTVFAGVSGSGKSSLLFDTIFAEGHRRFTESMSTFARRFMKNTAKPEIESIRGLSPCIAVNQRNRFNNPRSTVGTFSGIYDILRLLFARASDAVGEKAPRLLSDMFSFNNEKGACIHCKGLGNLNLPDVNKIVTNPEKSLLSGALDGTKTGKFYGDPFGQHTAVLAQVGKETGIDFSLPWNELTDDAKRIAMSGTGETKYNVVWNYKRKNREGEHVWTTNWLGFVGYIAEEYQRKHKDIRGTKMLSLFTEVKCRHCSGSGLKPEVLDYKINNENIYQFASCSMKELLLRFREMLQFPGEFTPLQNAVFVEIFPRIIAKLGSISFVGLSYLSPSRKVNSLSGGEFQRLRLAAQTSGNLSGITYILDEPTVGLHPRDTTKLIATLKSLRDAGNTVLVSEHDRDVINSADRIIEIGPEAGEKGGEIIADCTPEDLRKFSKSKTGKYLGSGYKGYKIKKLQNLEFGLKVLGARANNLKNIDVKVPIGAITAVTGVSGSGKSSLVHNVVYKSYISGTAVNADEVFGFDSFADVILSDQKLPTKSSVSIPATFIGFFDAIRKVFANTSCAKASGLKATHFSYLNKAGQCPNCKGAGKLKVSMDFMADVHLQCEVCKGKRYKEGILNVKFKDLNIFDVLAMSIYKATGFFADYIKISKPLQTLQDVGLGYLKLGQPLSTLSGGELQRLKLCKALTGDDSGNSLYLLDEPTTGLHFEDVNKLLKLLEDLRAKGNTIIVTEHNTDVIKNADFVIDLGPGGGDDGGYLIAETIPEKLKNVQESVTGKYL